jgi:hypothetical protein
VSDLVKEYDDLQE